MAEISDLKVTEIEDIPTFRDNFEKCLADLKKEQLQVDEHDYPIIIRGILLRSINISAFDDRHDKLFEKGGTVLPQDILSDLTKFHTTKTAKEGIYKTSSHSASGLLTSRRLHPNKSSDLDKDKLKKRSEFPKLPRDTIEVLGRTLHSRLSSWRALVMKGVCNRTNEEAQRLHENFFNGLSVTCQDIQEETQHKQKRTGK